MRFQAPRGTEDVLPGDSPRWQRLEQTFRALARRYGYGEIRTPTFEDAELFLRTAGATSDVVTKQMYNFQDKGGREVALKAEGTAPAMRALLEHGLIQPGGAVQRVYYITPVFRYERPQKGRLREHHQVGIELIGASAPAADAEAIEIAVRFYEEMGLSEFQVLVNSIGREACRESYRGALLLHARDYLASLEPEARERAEQNPLRMLDSKDPEAVELMRSAPSILDHLEPSSRDRLDEVCRLLRDAGIRYELEPRIVRGLDYYTETVFELQVTTIGAQSAIGGGGRYDGLVEQLGGPPTPSVGFGIGIERALLALEAAGKNDPDDRPDAFVAAAGEAHRDEVLRLARALRHDGFSVVSDPEGKSLKSQLRQAGKLRCRFALIVGDEESQSGQVSALDLDADSQERIPLADLPARLRR